MMIDRAGLFAIDRRRGRIMLGTNDDAVRVELYRLGGQIGRQQRLPKQQK